MNASMSPFLSLLAGRADVERPQDILCRNLLSVEGDWDDIDGGPNDETFVRMPSLHDLVIASRNQPATPPAALWADHPFGGDAA